MNCKWVSKYKDICVKLMALVPLVAVLLCTSTTDAQEILSENESFYYSELGPDDVIIVIPRGSEFIESGPEISDVIEAVGTVNRAKVPVHAAASVSSMITRYAGNGEKIIITASPGEWYYVRMFNGKEGFIEKRYIRTSKLFFNESTDKNNVDKRVNAEINALVIKFNNALSKSPYLESHQIIPHLSIITSNKDNDLYSLTVEYSAVDKNGRIIPSREQNNLQVVMQEFTELLFKQMLQSRAKSYKIVIRKPVFSSAGQVVNTQGIYAEITLTGENTVLSKLKDPGHRILSVANSTLDTQNLFKTFPF